MPKLQQERKAKILEMWDAGERDIYAIAQAAGSTYEGAKSMIYRSGRSKGRPIILGIRTSNALQAEAERRGMTPWRLAQTLIDIIVEEGMYDAVIDE